MPPEQFSRLSPIVPQKRLRDEDETTGTAGTYIGQIAPFDCIISVADVCAENLDKAFRELPAEVQKFYTFTAATIEKKVRGLTPEYIKKCSVATEGKKTRTSRGLVIQAALSWGSIRLRAQLANNATLVLETSKRESDCWMIICHRYDQKFSEYPECLPRLEATISVMEAATSTSTVPQSSSFQISTTPTLSTEQHERQVADSTQHPTQIDTLKLDLQKRTIIPTGRLAMLNGAKDIVDGVVASMTWLKHLRDGSPTISGILLYGPTGVGKTAFVMSMAKRHDLPLYYVTAGDIFSDQFGDSERFLKLLFEGVAAQGPGIILFDRIDGIFRRYNEHHSINAAFCSTWTAMEGARILVFGTTSRPWDLPTGDLLRRFTIKLHLQMPNLTACHDILQHALSYTRHHIDDDNLAALVQKTSGLSGGDISLAVQRARDAQIRLIVSATQFKRTTWKNQRYWEPCEANEAGSVAKTYRDFHHPSEVTYLPIIERDLKEILEEWRPTVLQADIDDNNAWARKWNTDSAE